MSVADDERLFRVVELVGLSKKALAACQLECSKANGLVEESRAIYQFINVLNPKVRFLDLEIEKQIDVLTILNSRLLTRSDALNEAQQELLQANQNVYEGLDQIFELLKQRVVEKEFDRDGKLRAYLGKTRQQNSGLINSGSQTRSNSAKNLFENSVGNSGTSVSALEEITLYDFVDIDSINTLKAETHEKLNILIQLVQKAGDVAKILTDNLAKFQEDLNQAKNIHTLDNSDIEFSISDAAAQNSISDSMAETLLEVGKHYDEAAKVLKTIQDNKENQINMKSFEIQTTRALQSVGKLREPLERLKAINEHLNSRKAELVSSQEHYGNLFNQLDLFGPNLAKCFSEMKGIEQEFEKTKAVVENNLIEFESLLSWYTQFRISHNQLILEIERRFLRLEEEQAKVREFLQQMELRWQEETLHQKKFWDSFGQFLPEALCPAIMEPLTKRQIFPETYSTRLPKLPESTIIRAKKELSKETEENFVNTSD